MAHCCGEKFAAKLKLLSSHLFGESTAHTVIIRLIVSIADIS